MSPLDPSGLPQPDLLNHPAPSRPASWRLTATLALAVASLGALGGCRAPGMKLDLKANSKEKAVVADGLNLTLHSVTPQLVMGNALRSRKPANLESLLAAQPGPYRVGPQDILLATVWDHPEITLPMGPNRTDASSGTVVEDDGTIFFPYVGKFKVAGMTTGQVRDSLTAQLAKVLRNPQVDVKVLSYRSQKVFVGGEVRNPAVYTVTDVPFTLAEALNRAGGFTANADDSRILLVRGEQTWRLDFRALMTAGNRAGQLLLQAGDSLDVPNVNEEPVYMMGELVKPGTLPLLHGNLSLAEAISASGGIQIASANASSIYVIRQTGSAEALDVYHLDARNPAAMVLADKFPLNPHDIVYVDAGTLVRYNRVMNMLLPSIAAVTNGALSSAQIYYFRKRL